MEKREQWERRREVEADFADAVSEARATVAQSAADAEVIAALQWAEENGVATPWLDGSLRKLQKGRSIRAAGFDPDTEKRVQSGNQAPFIGMSLDLREEQRVNGVAREGDVPESREICKRDHGTVEEQRACDWQNHQIRLANRRDRDRRSREIRNRK